MCQKGYRKSLVSKEIGLITVLRVLHFMHPELHKSISVVLRECSTFWSRINNSRPTLFENFPTPFPPWTAMPLQICGCFQHPIIALAQLILALCSGRYPEIEWGNAQEVWLLLSSAAHTAAGESPMHPQAPASLPHVLWCVAAESKACGTRHERHADAAVKWTWTACNLVISGGICKDFLISLGCVQSAHL